MSNDTVTKKKSTFLNNLKMQKLKSEMKTFKVDQLVKTADDHYIIFSGKTIFKSVNSGSEALLDIEKLKNGEITLGLTNLFEQKTINDVKDDVSNIEILDFYKDDYSSITRANDKEGNELIVGIRPGSMDDLTHSIINEGRKYIKTLNHIYHEDDVLNLLNTESDNITPGELKLLTDFLNNNNPNIKDFSVNDDTSKPDIMAYKSIELVEESEELNKIFKEYCIDDTRGQSQYIMYLIDKHTKNIIDWFTDIEKHTFIKIDDNNTVGIIRDNQFKTNTLGTFDCKIYDLNNTHFIDSTYSIETLNIIKDTVYRTISFNYKLEELSFNYNLLFAIPDHENNNSNDWYTPVFNPERNYKYELYKINDEYDCICATNRHSSGGSVLYTKKDSPDYKIGSMSFNTLTRSSSRTYYQLIHNIDWSVEVISELWKHPNSGKDIKYYYIENDSFKKCYNYSNNSNLIIFLPNKYDFTYIGKALVTNLNTGYEYYARLTNMKTYSKIGANEEKFAYIKEEIMGTDINSNSVSLTEYKIYAKTTSNDIKCVYYKTNTEFEIYTINVGSIKYMFTFGAKAYDNSSLPSSCEIIKSSTLIESRSVTLEEKIVNNKLNSYYVFDSDTVTKYYFTVFNNAVTKYSTLGYKFVTRTNTKYLAVRRDIFNDETYHVGYPLSFTTYDVSSNTYDDDEVFKITNRYSNDTKKGMVLRSSSTSYDDGFIYCGVYDKLTNSLKTILTSETSSLDPVSTIITTTFPRWNNVAFAFQTENFARIVLTDFDVRFQNISKLANNYPYIKDNSGIYILDYSKTSGYTMKQSLNGYSYIGPIEYRIESKNFALSDAYVSVIAKSSSPTDIAKGYLVPKSGSLNSLLANAMTTPRAIFESFISDILVTPRLYEVRAANNYSFILVSIRDAYGENINTFINMDSGTLTDLECVRFQASCVYWMVTRYGSNVSTTLRTGNGFGGKDDSYTVKDCEYQFYYTGGTNYDSYIKFPEWGINKTFDYYKEIMQGSIDSAFFSTGY